MGTAVRGFLEGPACVPVLGYLAQDAARGNLFAGPADDAFPRAVRRVRKRLGTLMEYVAWTHGMGALCAALGECSEIVARLRAAE